MEYILQTNNITKKYKKQLAVNGVCMNIARGDIYGFVGENGSGKTTIIRMITGLIFPTGGDVTLFGVKSSDPAIHKVRRRMGAVVESPAIYTDRSAYDNLKLQSKILGISDDERIKQVLEEVGLGELYGSKKKAGNFSLGMRQRLGIAMALLSQPEFLILDEPMNGLDPTGIVEIRELILRLNRQKGITFLISSHILTELSMVATKYGIISRGQLIREITQQQLQQECTGNIFIRADRPAELETLVRRLLPDHGVTTLMEGVKISGEVELNTLFTAICNENIRILSVNCTKSSLEDYYMSMIGGKHHG